jgi:hypothetical protein
MEYKYSWLERRVYRLIVWLNRWLERRVDRGFERIEQLQRRQGE